MHFQKNSQCITFENQTVFFPHPNNDHCPYKNVEQSTVSRLGRRKMRVGVSIDTWRVCLCSFTCVGWNCLAGCWAYKIQEDWMNEWSLLLYKYIAFWTILYIFIEGKKTGKKRGKDTRKILFLMLLKECTLDREKKVYKNCFTVWGEFCRNAPSILFIFFQQNGTVKANAYREIKLSLIRICLKLYNIFVI